MHFESCIKVVKWATNAVKWSREAFGSGPALWHSILMHTVLALKSGGSALGHVQSAFHIRGTHSLGRGGQKCGGVVSLDSLQLRPANGIFVAKHPRSPEKGSGA